jgi:hypothetical protein
MLWAGSSALMPHVVKTRLKHDKTGLKRLFLPKIGLRYICSESPIIIIARFSAVFLYKDAWEEV